jgi:hypothetical protein
MGGWSIDKDDGAMSVDDDELDDESGLDDDGNTTNADDVRACIV